MDKTTKLCVNLRHAETVLYTQTVKYSSSSEKLCSISASRYRHIITSPNAKIIPTFMAIQLLLIILVMSSFFIYNPYPTCNTACDPAWHLEDHHPLHPVHPYDPHNPDKNHRMGGRKKNNNCTASLNISTFIVLVFRCSRVLVMQIKGTLLRGIKC